MSLLPSSQDWMVLQCGACGNRMKVRREVALESRLICPGCHAPVPVRQEEIPSGILPSPAPAAGLPPDQAPPAVLPAWESQVTQGGPLATGPPAGPSFLPGARAVHPEFDGSPADLGDAAEGEEPHGAEDASEGGRLHPEQRRRVKIKKRRAIKTNTLRYLELADWDQKSLTGLPEAEIAADIWSDVQPLPEEVAPAGQENEYVVESVDDGDGQTRTRKKKVRRRRLLQGARLLFQRFTWLSRLVTTALGVVVAGIAVYGFFVLQQKYTAPDLPPVAEPAIDRRVLTHAEKLAAEQTVRDFLAADGIEAKLAFVRQPERIRPLMTKWYRGDRSAGPLQAGEVAMQQKSGGEGGSQCYFVMLGMPVHLPDPLTPGGTVEEMTFFAVEEIREGADSRFLVDWETSTGYQEMPLETYKSNMPSEPWPFRVFMKMDDYYNHDFSDLEWQCVSLYYPGRDFHLYGYISRVSPDGRKLLERVESGGAAGIIAELVYPPNIASRNQVIVKRMLQPSWFYDTAKDAAQLGDAIEPDAPTKP